MKLSENTINILKNFASINPSLLVNPGDNLTTMSVNKSIYASASVEETFPSRFAIYEMSKFLGVISLFKDPEFVFGDKQVKIESGRQTVNYTYTDPSMIVAPDPNKGINFPAADIEFSISQEELQKVVRATAVLQLPDIAVIGNGETITVTATNSKNPTTDIFGIEVGETDKTFSMYFDVSDIIKLISGNYEVKISSKGLSQWKTSNVLYYVATKANSSFSSN
jgi:hypothetical protein